MITAEYTPPTLVFLAIAPGGGISSLVTPLCGVILPLPFTVCGDMNHVRNTSSPHWSAKDAQGRLYKLNEPVENTNIVSPQSGEWYTAPT